MPHLDWLNVYADFAGPGHFNDGDILESFNGVRDICCTFYLLPCVTFIVSGSTSEFELEVYKCHNTGGNIHLDTYHAC